MSTTRQGEKLEELWRFWQDQWEVTNGVPVQRLLDLGQADHAKSFWNLLEWHGPQYLPVNCSVHILRHHVRPEWENNADGGHFRIVNSEALSEPSVAAKRTDRVWSDLVRTLIGEHFTSSKNVVGIGFTRKLYSQIISLWTNTDNRSVIATVQHDLFKTCQDQFMIKFIPHSKITKSRFTSSEVSLHRRTKTAPPPSAFISIAMDDCDDDDDDPLNELLTEEEQTNLASLRARRGLNLTLGDAPPPALNDSMHGRSRSESQATEVVPANPRVFSSLHSSATTASSGTYLGIPAPSPMKDWTMNWSPSQFQHAQAALGSTPFMFGQQVAQQFTQHVQQQQFSVGSSGSTQNSGDFTAPPPPPTSWGPIVTPDVIPKHNPLVMPTDGSNQAPPPPSSAVVWGAPSPIIVVPAQGYLLSNPPVPLTASYFQQPVNPSAHHHNPYMVVLPSQPQSTSPEPPKYTAHQSAVKVVLQSAPPPLFQSPQKPLVSAPLSNPSSSNSSSPARIIIGTVKAPPPPPPMMNSSPPPSSNATGGLLNPAGQSDASPFVCKGYAYPSGLNRKERRRIMFQGEEHPQRYPGSVFVGGDVPDGPITEQELQRVKNR